MQLSEELTAFLEDGLDMRRMPSAAKSGTSNDLPPADLADLRAAVHTNGVSATMRAAAAIPGADTGQGVGDGTTEQLAKLDMPEDEIIAQLDDLDNYDFAVIHPGNVLCNLWRCLLN